MQVRHEDGRHEREPSRLDDETNAETEHRELRSIIHGLRVHENRDKRVEVSIGENMRTFQIAVLDVGYVR